MLATLARTLPPDEQNYSFEMKWDGVRTIAFVDRRSIRLQSRNLLDMTIKYPELAAMPEALGVKSAILDGEIVTLDDADRPSFPNLQHRMHVTSPSTAERLSKLYPVWFVLFDLLYLNGKSLMHLPLTERRTQLLEVTARGPSWQVTPAHIGEGQAMLQSARDTRTEGIVAKRLDSIYQQGKRSADWLKLKVTQRQEFVVGGFVPEKSGRSQRVGALLLGYYDCSGKLQYVGGVGTGLDAEYHAQLFPMLANLKQSKSPFTQSVGRRDAIFVEPKIVVEIEYRRWPAGGQLHQGSFKGIRTDKSARQVVKETPGWDGSSCITAAR